ncbi:MAG TPA: hypothetical protein ENO20_14930 [Bacteroides sp.]|nr:hypothetical protein [Bacteroides sp.]
MEKLRHIHRSLKPRSLAFLAFLFTVAGTLAQTPTHYPTGKNPVQFNLVNILLFIVFPVLLVVLWVVIRRSGRKGDRERDESSE